MFDTGQEPPWIRFLYGAAAGLVIGICTWLLSAFVVFLLTVAGGNSGPAVAIEMGLIWASLFFTAIWALLRKRQKSNRSAFRAGFIMAVLLVILWGVASWTAASRAIGGFYP